MSEGPTEGLTSSGPSGLAAAADLDALADLADRADAEAPTEPSWGPSGWELITRFRHVHHTLERSLDRALENEGLSFAQIHVMAELGDRPNLHAGAIARRLGIRRQSAQALMSKLAAHHLIELTPKTEGVRIARLTDLGKAVARRCMDDLTPVGGTLDLLPATERRRLKKSLDDIEAALRPPRRHPWFS